MQSPSSRIRAFEMEWPVQQESMSGTVARFAGAYALCETCAHPSIRRVTTMMDNGARWYKDYNEFPEYASAEETEIIDGVIVADQAAELFMIDALARYLRKTPQLARVSVNKRVVGSSPVTWGYHKNLSTHSSLIPEISSQYLDPLALHYATSSPLVGAGAVMVTNTGSYYSYSQKHMNLGSDYHVSTTSTKPLINLRIEPHASDDSQIARIHNTSSDPHISPWATMMSFGTDGLVLRMIEQNRHLPATLDVSSYISNTGFSKMARDVAVDYTGSRKYRFTNGSNYTALEAQKMIIEVASQTEHDSEEAFVLQEWQRAVTDMEHDRELLADRSDAIAKHAIIRAATDRLRSKNVKNPVTIGQRLFRLDTELDKIADITREDVDSDDEIDVEEIYLRSTPARLRELRYTGVVVDRKKAWNRVFEPPKTTRAAVRSQLLRSQFNEIDNMTWSSVTFTDKSDKITIDPFDTNVETISNRQK